MRNIKLLLEENEHVWFAVTEECKQDFYEELLSLGLRFMNGDAITIDAIGRNMGVSQDGTVGYISNFVWYHSFSSSSPTPPKINYKKFHNNEENYLITKPDIVPVKFDK